MATNAETVLGGCLALIGIIVLVILGYFLSAWIIMWAWNSFLVYVTKGGVPLINIWQALAGSILITAIKGIFSFSIKHE